MKINDEYIIKIFTRKDNRIDSHKCNDKWLNENIEIKKYLESRFDYFNGKYSDVINLIKNKVKEWPKCPICKEYLNHPENKHCSYACEQKDPLVNDKKKNTYLNNYGVEHPLKSKEIKKKIKQTNLQKYGVENPSQNEEIKEKKRQTSLKNYGVDNPFKSEDIKEKIKEINLQRYGFENVFQNEQIRQKYKSTCKEKYGVENPSQSEKIKKKKENTNLKNIGFKNPLQSEEIKKKVKNTNLQKYGVENPSQLEEIKKKKEDSCLKHYGVKSPLQSEEVKEKSKKTCLKKYGVEVAAKSEIVKEKLSKTLSTMESKEKQYNTKKKNNSFNTSKPEEEIYEKLCKQLGKNNILRNYNKDSRYPFMVDFYIKSKDLFIECNFNWTHGEHWFNENSKSDLKISQKWNEKSKDSDFYKIALKVWTVKDVEKRDTANKNGLNYIVFWKESDYEKWISKGCPKKFQNK